MNQAKNLAAICTNIINKKAWHLQILAAARIPMGIATVIIGFLFAAPVFAHHPLGEKTPGNLLEGFVSGLGHPVIGLDHLAFVVALGLLAAARPQGFLIPISFVIAAMIGTGLHLMSLNLPVVELVISGSVLLFGVLLVSKDIGSTLIISLLAGLVGVFHGFAYGEAIFGAEMTPLISYLAGFTTIQLLISISGLMLARKFLNASSLRSAGLIICGIGMAFLSTQVMNLILPTP